MIELGFPDRHHLSAARGWAELGCADEAGRELAKVATANHPEVLEVRWQILAGERRWAEALDVAEALVATAPECAAGWIDQSYALHEMQRTAEAWERLQPAAAKFKGTSVIAYNLACYACRLGDLRSARQWLKEAVRRSGKREIQSMALDDSDLETLWPEIARW